MEQSRKYSRVQAAAFQKLWLWHYQKRFPVALYAPLQEYIITLQDEQVEAFLFILETLLDAHRAKYPMGGVLVEPNPHQEYADRFDKEMIAVRHPQGGATLQSFDASEWLQAVLQRFQDRK